MNSRKYIFSCLSSVPKIMPKHGIIVAAYYSEEAKLEVINAGFYFISIIDKIAKLAVPTGLVAKEW